MEKWKDIIGYEGNYKVSKDGQIAKIRKHKDYEDDPLKIHKCVSDKDGYKKTSLRKEGKRKYYFVHRLVALNFIPNPENHPIVNHKNGIKDDNRVENLEWCTHSHNTKHSFQSLGRKGKSGTEKMVYQIDPESKVIIAKHKTLKDASLSIGRTECYVSSVINYKQGNGSGFKWVLAEEGVETIESTDFFCDE